MSIIKYFIIKNINNQTKTLYWRFQLNHISKPLRIRAQFSGHVCSAWLKVGFPFYIKKLFTRNIVTDVTDGYYVVITVVTM
jgi:hypothetical protein